MGENGKLLLTKECQSKSKKNNGLENYHLVTIIVVNDSDQFTGWINFTKNRKLFPKVFLCVRKTTNFTLRKPGRHNFN